MVSAPLPDLNSLDVEALRALVMAQHVEIERQQELHQQAHSNYAEQYSAHVETLSAQRLEIERLQLLIAKLRRMVFGTKSEKVRVQFDQLELQLEELDAAQAAAETHVEPLAAKTRTSRRKPLPEHLTREVVNHLPEQTCCCPGCGGELHHFGEDVAEVLEYVPANFKPGSPRTGLGPWGGR
jgi:DNA repair exonuclease SbcCD ATPase subunit